MYDADALARSLLKTSAVSLCLLTFHHPLGGSTSFRNPTEPRCRRLSVVGSALGSGAGLLLNGVANELTGEYTVESI